MDERIFRTWSLEDMYLTEKLFALRSVALFSVLRESELLPIAEAMQVVQFEPGARVLPSGAVPPRVLVCVKGSFTNEQGDPVDAVAGLREMLLEKPLQRALYAAKDQALSCLSLQKNHAFTMVYECPELLVGLLEKDTAFRRRFSEVSRSAVNMTPRRDTHGA